MGQRFKRWMRQYPAEMLLIGALATGISGQVAGAVASNYCYGQAREYSKEARVVYRQSHNRDMSNPLEEESRRWHRRGLFAGSVQLFGFMLTGAAAMTWYFHIGEQYRKQRLERMVQREVEKRLKDSTQQSEP